MAYTNIFSELRVRNQKEGKVRFCLRTEIDTEDQKLTKDWCGTDNFIRDTNIKIMVLINFLFPNRVVDSKRQEVILFRPYGPLSRTYYLDSEFILKTISN